MLFNLMLKQPITFILIAIPLLYSVIFHELAHAYVAYKFGDPTPRVSGRFTFNPLGHLDPIGTLMLLLFGFGWAKPVPINTANIKPQKIGIICCSLAGVTANFLIAFICLLLFRLTSFIPTLPHIKLMLIMTAKINLILAAFNIIPIPPLDGSRVVSVLSPPPVQKIMNMIEQYGLIIIVILLYLGVFDPVITYIQQILFYLIAIFL